MYISDLKEALNDNKILLNHYDLLETLAYDDSVVCVGYKNGKYYLFECCDEYFGHKLTKKECIELSEMFKEIAEDIDT